MLRAILTWSLDHRLVVIGSAVAIAVAGGLALRSLPFDAFPDTTPIQVVVNTSAAGLSPAEVERQITSAIEQAIAGLPGLEEVRSISKFGFSQITATFEDGTDIYFARQQVGERLQAVELPDGLERPSMGPVATGLGEVFHYLVTGDARHSLADLRTAQDWILKPQLRSIPGVAEVVGWGGHVKQFQVRVEPRRLARYDVTFADLVEALEKGNVSVGGGEVVHAGESHLVRGIGLVTNEAEIGDVVITARAGAPVRVRDVATVAVGPEIRRGAVTAEGKGEAVLGLVFMRSGENSEEVTRRIAARLEAARKSLPAGMEARPVYERTDLVHHVLHTVRTNLFEGALLVIAVLFAFLGHLRAGLLVALAIPFSLLFAFNLMLRAGVAGTLMSLGALDFGLIVDSSVIVVENAVRRLGARPEGVSVRDTVREAAIEVRKPTLFGELIILIVYLPILTLEGIEGKMFRPMALTVVFALLGSLVFSLTLAPVLASLFLKGRIGHRESPIVTFARKLYVPALDAALRRPRRVLAGAALVVLAAAAVGARLGGEFLPRLGEETIVANTVHLAGISLDESVRYGLRLEKILREEFPDEVRDAWTRTGTAEVATDPMGIELSDLFVTLTPRKEWKRARTQEELVGKMQDALRGLPGMRVAFTQPIEMRTNEMVAGIRADVGVKLFGDDLELLRDRAAKIDSLLRTVPGSADVTTEQITGQPVLEVRLDPRRLSRHGISAREALTVVEAIGGIPVGEVREGDRRFDLTVGLAPIYRTDPEAVRRILLTTASGERVALSDVATIADTTGPSTITREWGKRRIVVQANVRGRDVESFVNEVRKRIGTEVPLPSGYFVDFGGQFEHLERARTRLLIVVPMALGLIFLLLYLAHRSVRDALLLFTGVPLAAVGGILALAARGMPFTISAGVGFIALSGVAVLNGLVLVSAIRGLCAAGHPLPEAVREGALARLRPVLMTALVASLGFVPMALSTGVGAEIQRPLATTVIGGIVSSTLLTLVVLPVLYAAFGSRSVRAE